MPKKINFLNAEIGNLKVLESCDGVNNSGSCLWKCQCVCGREIMLGANDLKNRNSCGCYGRIPPIGLNFDKFTVNSINPDEFPLLIKLLCECGKPIVCTINDLANLEINCECKNTLKNKNLCEASLFAWIKYYKLILNLNKKFNCEPIRFFDLPDKLLAQNFKCAMTGKTLTFKTTFKHNTNETNACLCRINPKEGFSDFNTVWVDKKIVKIKNRYTLKEIYEVAKKITEFKNG